MKIKITADQTSDIPKELCEKLNITLIPIFVNLGDKEFLENELSPEKLYEYVDTTKTLPKTAAKSAFDYQQIFENLRQEYDAIIHISLSFELSCTGTNAMLASKEVNNVFVIDSKNLSSGSGLLAISAAEKVLAGKDVTTILAELNNEIPKIQASFIISKFDYLRKGGRCSTIAAFGANLLKLKIRIELIGGKMVVAKKYIGKYFDVLKKYVDDMIEAKKPNYERCFITYSSEMPENDELAKYAKEKGFKEVIKTHAGCTICAHCGPNTIGILYLSE